MDICRRRATKAIASAAGRIPSQAPSLPWLDLALLAGVLLFGVYSLRLVTIDSPRAANGLAPLANPDAERRPASALTTADSRAHITTLHLPCLRGRAPASALDVSARLVQLQTGSCGGPARDWKARNERTGEEIQVFVGGDGALSTSYFTLREGRNRLVFTSQGPGGRSEAFELHRTTADGD